jgi:hypothetical protein
VKVTIDSLGHLYFYLAMRREDGELVFPTWTQMGRLRQSLASELWALMASSDIEGDHSSWNLSFGSDLIEDDVPDFEQHLDQTIDRFVKFIAKAGGLKKYLPQ